MMTNTAQTERAPRQPARIALIFDRGDRYVAANLMDISESGVLLAGDEIAPVGKQVALYADLNDNESWPIHIEGLVVRHGPTSAGASTMGVRFLYATVAQLAQMRLFVQALQERGAAAEVSAVAAPVALPVVQQGEPPLPAQAPSEAPKAETDVDTGPIEFKPIDALMPAQRRAHLTLAAMGMPEMSYTPRAGRTPLRNVYGILDLDERYASGEVLNLSESGFFLATDEPLEIGQDVTFIPHGDDDHTLPFEMKARVTRVEPRQGIACGFSELNSAERQALRAYIAQAIVVRRRRTTRALD